MRNMRSLSISRMSTTSIGADDFKDFGVELEDLQITRAALTNIQAHAFKYVRGLKRLDFSENSLQSIESDAFHEVCYIYLCIVFPFNLVKWFYISDRAFFDFIENSSWLFGYSLTIGCFAAFDFVARIGFQ